MKKYAKWHKHSAMIMLISMVICLYTGHKMTAPQKKNDSATE